jgi:hypothetical protein
MEKRPVGRPSTDTPELREAVLDLIEHGLLSFETACRQAGSAPNTVRGWMAADPSFQSLVKSAQDCRNARLMDTGLNKALSGDPKHDAMHIFLLKTLCGLRETQVLEHTTPKPVRLIDMGDDDGSTAHPDDS